MSAVSAIYRRAADVRYRVVDGEAVVLSQNRGEVLGLNDVGARLLELCDGVRELGAVLDVLSAEFDVERERLEREAGALVEELVGIGVLVRAD